MASARTKDFEVLSELEFKITKFGETQQLKGKEKHKIVKNIQNCLHKTKRGTTRLDQLKELYKAECDVSVSVAEQPPGSIKLHVKISTEDSLNKFKAKKSDSKFVQKVKEIVVGSFEENNKVTIVLALNVEKKLLVEGRSFFLAKQQDLGTHSTQNASVSGNVSLSNQGRIGRASINSNYSTTIVNNPHHLSPTDRPEHTTAFKNDGDEDVPHFSKQQNIINHAENVNITSKNGDFYEIVTKTFVAISEDDNITENRRKELLKIARKAVRNKMQLEKSYTDILGIFKGYYGAQSVAISHGSILLTLAIDKSETLERLWNDYKDGSVSSKLTVLLITPEIEEEVGAKLTLEFQMNFKDYKEGIIFFEKKEQENDAMISRWDVDDVYQWISLGLGLQKLAEKMKEGGIDGKTLLWYELSDLCSDFGMKLGEARKLLYALKRWQPGDTELFAHPNNSQYESKTDLHTLKEQVPRKKENIEHNVTHKGSLGTHSTSSQDFVEKNLKSFIQHAEKQKVSKTIQQRLNKLIVGDEKGRLTKSFFPILVINEPPQEIIGPTENKGSNLEDAFGFLGEIEWTAVFDCHSKSAEDGICSFVETKRKVKKLLPFVFKEIDDFDKFQTDIGFSVDTPWIFCNGRDGIPDAPEYDRREWSKKRSKDIQNAISFLTNPCIIPEGRVLVIILLLSDHNIGIMAELWFLYFSAFRGNEKITIICEDSSLHEKFAVEAMKWISQDDLSDRSMVGNNWNSIHAAMVNLAGLPRRSKYILPFCNEKGELETCHLRQREACEWTDIEILPYNECEEEDLLEYSTDFEEKKMNEELNFYRGNKVSWWNFAFSDSKYNNGKGYNHVLQRGCQNQFSTIISNCLEIKPQNDGGKDAVTTITIFHEHGSGGSTLARQGLWNFHKKIRCCVVKEVTENSVNQILEFRSYGYERKERDCCPPVLVLLEDSDTQETTYLLEEMEYVSKILNTSDTICVFLHCRRTTNPEINAKEDCNKLSVPVAHRLNKYEKCWFKEKFEELEWKNEVNQMYEPERLLAFMVMKEECSEIYLKNVVQKILQDLHVQGTNAHSEIKVLKYIALMNSYGESFVMPVSCCDQLMNNLFQEGKQQRHIGHQTQKLWEEHLSPACQLLLTRGENKNYYGHFSSLRIVHLRLASEILRQLLLYENQDLSEAMIELLSSTILSKKVYISRFLREKMRDVLTRRKKIDYGDEVQTDFAPFIEDLYKDKSEKAFKVLQKGFEVLQDPFVGQQLARLYTKLKFYDKAHQEIDKSLNLNENSAFLLDTKGHIYSKRIQVEYHQKYKKKHKQLSADKASNLIELACDAMDIFQKSQDVVKTQKLQNYYGYGNVAKIAFQLLEILHKCVVPFLHKDKGKECLQSYIMEQNIPSEVHIVWAEYHEKLYTLPTRVSECLEVLQELRTYTKSGSNSSVARRFTESLAATNEDLSFSQEYYFGRKVEGIPQDVAHYSPKSMARLRRYVALGYGATGFYKIFDHARRKQYETLQKTKETLLQNGTSMNFGDLLNVIFINLASASGKLSNQNAIETEEEVFGFVNQLYNLAQKDNIFSAFLKMMMLWPRENSKVSNGRDKDFLKSLKELKNRWHRTISFSDSALDEVKHSKKHLKPFRMKRAQTFFFLAKDEGLRAFSHVNELKLGQNQLEKSRAQFWNSDLVTDRLQRLTGMLSTSTTVTYVTPQKEVIYIKQAPSWSGIPGQDKVTFYLGFSFEGPLAFNVTDRNQRSAPMKSYKGAYPSYLSINPHQKLQELRDQMTSLLSRASVDKTNKEIQLEISQNKEKTQQWQNILHRMKTEED